MDPPNVVTGGEFREVVAIVCVCVANSDGVKAQEVAKGEANITDKYVWLSAEGFILKSVDGTELSQTLTWPSAFEQTSLFIH